MLIKALLKRNIKACVKLGIVFVSILTMYTMVILYMFDPALADLLKQYQSVMPTVMAAVGMTGDYGTLTGFIHTYLYGFLMLIVPMLFTMMVCSKLVVKYMDSGAMACILATPHSRKSIIFTQAISIIISLLVLIILLTGIGIIGAEIMFPNQLDLTKYIQLNMSLFLLHFALSGIMFFSSCYFNTSQGYLILGAGLPFGFYLIQMLGNMGGKLEWMNKITIFSLFSGAEIMNESYHIVMRNNIILFVIGILLYIVGILYFTQKDMSL